VKISRALLNQATNYLRNKVINH